jgi:SAM-dependent methyltransferase
VTGYLELWRYWQQGAREFAREDFRLYREAQERLSAYLNRPLTGLRILDVGCGQHYPETLLYHNDGHHITGIDLDVVGVGPSWRKYAAVARQNGIKRAAKSLVREMVFDPIYFAELDRQAGRKLSHAGIDLRTADAAALPFDDATFDLIVSTAAFEHISDLDAAVREVARVLKPGGLTHIDIHLFTSLSGGHHLEWTWPEREQERTVPPWDHLRQNRHPVDYFLNRQREQAYRACFEQHLHVAAWLRGRREGERYLTPELRAELIGYTEDELLTRNIVVIGAKSA